MKRIKHWFGFTPSVKHIYSKMWTFMLNFIYPVWWSWLPLDALVISCQLHMYKPPICPQNSKVLSKSIWSPNNCFIQSIIFFTQELIKGNLTLFSPIIIVRELSDISAITQELLQPLLHPFRHLQSIIRLPFLLIISWYDHKLPPNFWSLASQQLRNP